MSAVFDFRYISIPRGQQPHRLDGLSHYDLKDMEWIKGRREQVMWLAGRMLAKQLILQQLSSVGETRIGPHDITILSRDEHGQPMRPQVWIHQQRFPRSLSLSRTDQGVLVALSRSDEFRLGVDLALPHRSLPGPFDNWFTPSERYWLDQQEDPPAAAAQMWAIKQAYYKITNRGERFVPRHFEVTVASSGSFDCAYSGYSHQLNPDIMVNQYDGHVAALVVVRPKGEASAAPAVGDYVIPQWQTLRLHDSRVRAEQPAQAGTREEEQAVERVDPDLAM